MSRPASSPLEVVAVEMAPRDRSLRGFHLGVPKAGESPDARELLLRGWVLAEDDSALGIEIVHGERVIARSPVSLERPDIARGYPDLDHAATAGFERRLNLLAARGELQLDVRAVLGPLERAPVASIRLRAAARPRAGEESVTVVIPCFNQAHFLNEAIESVLAQTHPDVEIVVVDDGSRDNTAEVAANYPGVSCVRQDNRGLAAARNTGLERVRSEFVLFLDSDDRLLPEAIETGLRELRDDPEAAMAAGTWRLIGEDGKALPSSPPELPTDVYPALLESCFISTPAAVIYRRRLFEEIGDFDPAISASADYDVYLRVAARHRVRTHSSTVAEYRRHGANMTRDAELIMRSEIAVLQRQRSAVQHSPGLRRARERGLRRSRAYHGERMVDEVRRQVDEGRRGKALRTAASVARLYPRGAPEALRALGRRGPR